MFRHRALAQIAAPEKRRCSELRKKTILYELARANLFLNIILSILFVEKEIKKVKLLNIWYVFARLGKWSENYVECTNVMRSPKCNEYQLGFTRGLNAQQSWTKHALCILIFCLKGAGDLIKGYSVLPAISFYASHTCNKWCAVDYGVSNTLRNRLGTSRGTLNAPCRVLSKHRRSLNIIFEYINYD